MRRTVLITALVILGGVAVTGCENSQKAANVVPAAVKKYAQATTLTGLISNDKGVVKEGKLEVSEESGRIITQVTVENGHYSVEIPAGTVLPILLTFSSASGSEKLVTAVVHNTITKYEINPLTTAIAKSAKAMGGYTHANMTRAAADTVSPPDANKTTSGWKGDPTKQYGGWH